MRLMFKKKSNEPVEVYKIVLDNLGTPVALTYSVERDQWEYLRLAKLRPYGKQEQEARNRLRIREAVWQTSDNHYYCNADYELALEHEIEIMKDETVG